jgi:hypothetical protein
MEFKSQTSVDKSGAFRSVALKLVQVSITWQNKCHHQNLRATQMALTHSAIIHSLTENWGINLHLDTSDINESEPEPQFVTVIHYVMYA